MKKVLSVVLALIMLFLVSSVAFAETTRDSVWQEFEVYEASNGMTYGVYTPEISVNTKYPLVVYVHGLGHAWNNDSFRQSGLTYWAEPEMQAKFTNGGAYLLCPKIPEYTITATQHERVFALIDEFVQANADTVDTNQIYIMGGSAGGALAWRMLIHHPGYFKRAVLLCACKFLTNAEMEAVKDTPIWRISAVQDPLVWYVLFSGPNWKKITKISDVNDQNRHTVFQNVVTLPDGSNAAIAHLLAKTIGYNLCYFNNRELLSNMQTVDGNGNTVELSFDNSIIEWLQADAA